MKIEHKRNEDGPWTLTTNNNDVVYCTFDHTQPSYYTFGDLMSTNQTTLLGDAGNELISFDVDNEKIMIDGEDATMNYTAIAMACKKFLASQIKQHKG